jgi:hypothetical protein
MTEQSTAAYLEELAREVRANTERLAELEQSALAAYLGLGTPARLGPVDLSPLSLSPGGSPLALDSGSGPVVPASVIQPGAVEAESFSASAFIRLVTNEGATVVIDVTGLTVTNGKITVTNPGSVVIIDGTSNMFKIQASGSSSVTVAADTSGATDVTLTGLGTLATTPAVHAHLNDTSASTDARHLGHWLEWWTSTGYVASTSGGSPTVRTAPLKRAFTVSTLLNGSSQEVVRLHGYNGQGTSVTVFCYYHVLKEAAI